MIADKMVDFLNHEKLNYQQNSDNCYCYYDYQQSIDLMSQKVDDIIAKSCKEALWFLEYNHLYTVGMSDKIENIIHSIPANIPCFPSKRGGKITYHGPGQRIVYIMLNLKRIHHCQPDIKLFVKQIAQWLIKSLQHLQVKAFTIEKYPGVWIKDRGEIKKIASIGIRLKKWISYYGISININPEMTFFRHIKPCGIEEYGITSLNEMGVSCDKKLLDELLLREFSKVF